MVRELLDVLLESRKRRAMKLLNKYGDAWLIISHGRMDSNIEYLLGVHTFGLVVSVLTPDGLHVLINSLEKSFIKDKEHIDSFETFYRRAEFLGKLRQVLRELSGMHVLADFSSPEICPQASALTYHMYRELKYLSETYDIELKPSGRFVYELRETKTMEEIKALERSVEETLKILDNIIVEGIIKPGVSERKVAAELYRNAYMISEPAFEIIVASGPNTANPHHVVSDRKISGNDIVYIDFGIRLLTMCSDITRVFLVGNPGDDVLRTYEAVFEAQTQAIGILKANIDCSEPDSVARNVLRDRNIDPKLFKHSLGHPLGVDVHDVGPPLGDAGKGRRIKRFSAYTVEPAVYFEGKYGIRIEDDVVILEDGVKRLSRAPEEPIGV